MKDDELFDWDNAKASKNMDKHGVSFEFAMCIWDDPMMFRVKVADDPEDGGLS